MHIEELANKGKLSFKYQKINDINIREKYNKKTNKGLKFIFDVRANYSDFMFINNFIDQEFVDKYKLFVVGRRLNSEKGVWEYYVKSRDAEEYKKMLIDSLYHPPHITVDETKMKNNELYLNHHFEGKPLVQEYIHNTMLGIEYLYGNCVHLETSEIVEKHKNAALMGIKFDYTQKPEYKRVLYTIKNKGLSKKFL